MLKLTPNLISTVSAMLIFDPKQIHSLMEFGIDIPISAATAEMTFHQLRLLPALKHHLSAWHINRIETAIDSQDIQRAHATPYVNRLFSDQLEKEIIQTYELIDAKGAFYRYNPDKAQLPLSQLLQRTLLNVAGTFQCCQVALGQGFCFYFGGGMHHAHYDHGSGFCLLNDVVIAIRKLQAGQQIKVAWVIDVDVHKGDGTAAITHDDNTIVTLSCHMAKGWPLDTDSGHPEDALNPAFIPSEIDIPIETGEEAFYGEALSKGLQALDTYPSPDLAVILLGADPYEKDLLPSTSLLNLSLAQMNQRDHLIYDYLSKRGIPQAYLMAGGYGQDAWEVYTQFLSWSLMDQLH
jgi:acetoin utilization deacetylase AcuC-like enzyme